MKKKRLVIVGNASLGFWERVLGKKDFSQFIDASDVVIRMNKTPNFKNNTGTKTSILGVINMGTPAIDLSYKDKLNPEVLIQIKEIWCSRPQKAHESRKVNKNLPLLLNTNLAPHIVDYQKVDTCQLKYIASELYRSLFDLVNGTSATVDGFEPSSGLCFLAMVLREIRFSDYEKFVIGFTWKGWEGHNWEVEEQYFRDMHKKGEIKILE